MTVPQFYDFPKLIRESGFSFDTEKPNTSINWNDIRVIDINKLIRERDFATVDAHIYEVLKCHLESEFNLQILDNGFVKLFRLSQLSIEYLLQCRRHLDLIVMALKSEIREVTQENLMLKKELSIKGEEFKKMENKSRKRRKKDNYGELSNILKQLSFSNANVVGEESKILMNKCLHCNKVFLNHFYLQSHITRRHTEYIENKNDSSDDKCSPREKFSSEIKELKDRLNATEKMCQSIERNVANEVQKEEIESPEKSSKKNLDQDSKTENMIELLKKWKSEEDSKNENQIESIKEELFRNIKMVRDKLEALEKTTETKNDDKLSIISNEIHKQANELESIKKDLLDKSFNNLTELKSQVTNQEKFWENKLQALEVGHLQVIEELKTNVMTYIGKSQNVYQHYQSKIDLLENKAKEQMETSMQHAKILTKVADDTNKLISNENRLKNANSLQFLTSQETLPPYEKKSESSEEEIMASQSQKKSYNSSIQNKKENSSDPTSSDNRTYLNQKPSPKSEMFNVQKYQTPKNKFNKKKSVQSKKSSVKEHDSDSDEEREIINEKTSQNIFPNITKALKSDFLQMVNDRLDNLGVSSNGTIPTEKYKIYMKDIDSKKNMAAKKYKGYKKIERHLLKRLNERLHSSKTDQSHNSTQNDNKVSNLGLMSSLIKSVKNKAARISKSTDNLSSFSKKKVLNNSRKSDQFNIRKSDQHLNGDKLSARSILAMIETKNSDDDHENDLRKNVDSTFDSEFTSNSDEDESNGKKIVTKVISHASKSSIEDILTSPIKKPRNSDLFTGENKDQLQSTGRFSKSTNESVSNITEETSSIESIITNDLFEDNPKTMLRRKSFSEDNILTESPKGVLKNVSSNSSLIKKKVYFDLEANKIESMSINGSVDTSVGDGSDDSHRKIAVKEDVIHLSTKQSPKIAEIAASIESQMISHCKIKPPVGSIETFFQAKSVQPAKLQNNGNKTESTEKTSPHPITSAPMKKPSMNSTNSDMELSDWSIDDLISNNK